MVATRNDTAVKLEQELRRGISVLADGSQQTTTFTADVNNANTQTLSVNSAGFGDLQMTPWANSSFSFTSGGAQSSATLHFVPRTTFNNGFYGPGIDAVRIIEGQARSMGVVVEG